MIFGESKFTHILWRWLTLLTFFFAHSSSAHSQWGRQAVGNASAINIIGHYFYKQQKKESWKKSFCSLEFFCLLRLASNSKCRVDDIESHSRSNLLFVFIKILVWVLNCLCLFLLLFTITPFSFNDFKISRLAPCWHFFLFISNAWRGRKKERFTHPSRFCGLMSGGNSNRTYFVKSICIHN
jgi:hypothetical protein